MTRWLIWLVVIAATHLAAADPVSDAKQQYRDGQAAFDLAHYDDAIASWQRSYDISQAPGLLYNLGQAYRLRAQSGDCALARSWYERFVQVAPPSPQRELADGYVAQLAACARPVASDVSPPSGDVRSKERSVRNRKIAVAAVGGGGIALLVTGLAFGAHASTLGTEVTNACAVSCDWSAEKTKDAAGHRDAAIGYTLDVLGVLAIGGSAAAYYFGIYKSEIHVAPIATRSSVSGAVLSWSATW